MGLHLNYELRLPGDTSPDQVRSRLAELRQRAVELPFHEVSDVIAATDPVEDWPHHVLRLFADLVATPYGEDLPPLQGDPSTAMGFVVEVGAGSEIATFALQHRQAPDGTHREWYWHCFCKTQYASTVSDEHLITCHTSLVGLLDHAITLGFNVVVYDETHYWETRDTARLLAEVHRMNQIVAAFAGAMSDCLPGDPGRVKAPIFEHPRFERLEMGEE